MSTNTCQNSGALLLSLVGAASRANVLAGSVTLAISSSSSVAFFDGAALVTYNGEPSDTDTLGAAIGVIDVVVIVATVGGALVTGSAVAFDDDVAIAAVVVLVVVVVVVVVLVVVVVVVVASPSTAPSIDNAMRNAPLGWITSDCSP